MKHKTYKEEKESGTYHFDLAAQALLLLREILVVHHFHFYQLAQVDLGLQARLLIQVAHLVREPLELLGFQVVHLHHSNQGCHLYLGFLVLLAHRFVHLDQELLVGLVNHPLHYDQVVQVHLCFHLIQGCQVSQPDLVRQGFHPCQVSHLLLAFLRLLVYLAVQQLQVPQ